MLVAPVARFEVSHGMTAGVQLQNAIESSAEIARRRAPGDSERGGFDPLLCMFKSSLGHADGQALRARTLKVLLHCRVYGGKDFW
jgi:hypothetical protein